MSKICFITGGQRSGKSRFAMELAEKQSDRPVFLATSRIWDEDFAQRVKRHRQDRGANWRTIEEDLFIAKHDLKGETVVLDCITLWLTNIFHDNQYDVSKSLSEAKKEWKEFINTDFQLFVVSNELGMGVHAENEASRNFVDFQGWMNQYIASYSDEVYLMISGIPVKIR
jgi:adenosylcobinamide kinase / adenosylcobinamide-phosphate guanylyltransferase